MTPSETTVQKYIFLRDYSLQFIVRISCLEKLLDVFDICVS